MRFMSLKEVMHKTSLARATIYLYMKNGEFPKSVSLLKYRVAWLEEEVNDWMKKRLVDRNL